ncbi:MAG TPA: PH domain-containing protein [Saprospiraceae bacterium]|nr:PH domain-containing protein [Saprospiraceae bacterium]HMU02773.1 PH domain-containing protein [Saprospiraceae bacterium]
MEFENNQLPSQSLPSINDIDFESLEINYQKVSIYFTAFFFVVAIIIYLGIGIFVEELFDSPLIWIVVGGWILVTSLFVFLSYKSYFYEGFALRERDIVYKSGMFFRSTIIVPFNRVQHCEINQGPIDRYFGLSELSLFTAGGSSSDLNIPGLSQETAAKLKQFITNKVAHDEEE